MDKFNFFMPVEISKGKDSQGNETMKVGGIASTDRKDTDGEFLDPKGFDVQYLLSSGFINWHHQMSKDPNAIIGEPTSAKITSQGLYIEAELYQTDQAKKVFALAKTLEKMSPNRRLGFSIEGQALERDPFDKNKVTKARITGVAITPHPKNPGTLLQIMKGEFTGQEPEYELDEKGNVLEIQDNNNKFTVTKALDIEVTTQTTEDLKPIIPSSISNSKKYRKNNKQKKSALLQQSENRSIFTALNKSEAFDVLLNVSQDYEIVNGIYQMAKKIAEKDVITNKDLEKALRILDLAKGMSEEDDESEEDDAPIPQNKKKLPIEEQRDEQDDDEEEQDEDPDELDDDNDADNTMKKGVETEQLIDLVKSLTSNFATTEDVVRTQRNTFEKQRELFKAVGQIGQANTEEINSLKKGMNDLLAEMQKVTSFMDQMQAIPAQRKSVQTTSFLQKGGFENQPAAKKSGKTLNRNNPQEVSETLMRLSGIEKGEYNDFYATAVLGYESTHVLSKAVMDDLSDKGYEII